MPDGDRVHGKLAGRYQKVYKQLCEGHFSEDHIAHEVLLPVKEELQRQGDAVIGLIDRAAARCEQIVIELAVGNQIDWDKEALMIEKQSQRMYAKQTARDLVAGACKEQLQDIRRHGAHNLNFPVEIMRKYMWKLYEAKFQAIVPLKKRHHTHIPQFAFAIFAISLVERITKEELLIISTI